MIFLRKINISHHTLYERVSTATLRNAYSSHSFIALSKKVKIRALPTSTFEWNETEQNFINTSIFETCRSFYESIKEFEERLHIQEQVRNAKRNSLIKNVVFHEKLENAEETFTTNNNIHDCSEEKEQSLSHNSEDRKICSHINDNDNQQVNSNNVLNREKVSAIKYKSFELTFVLLSVVALLLLVNAFYWDEWSSLGKEQEEEEYEQEEHQLQMLRK